jgi:hypothetical protein
LIQSKFSLRLAAFFSSRTYAIITKWWSCQHGYIITLTALFFPSRDETMATSKPHSLNPKEAGSESSRGRKKSKTVVDSQEFCVRVLLAFCGEHEDLHISIPLYKLFRLIQFKRFLKLKGQCHKIFFNLRFFHWTIHLTPPVNLVKCLVSTLQRYSRIPV